LSNDPEYEIVKPFVESRLQYFGYDSACFEGGVFKEIK